MMMKFNENWLAIKHEVRHLFGAKIQSQIGEEDSRLPIFFTAKLPWRMICALTIDFGDGGEALHGTGWFSGPRTIVTAGHCVYDAARGWAQNIRVTPGLNGGGSDAAPFGSVVVTRFSAAAAWTASASKAHDIGAIHLDADLGQKLGWFAFGDAAAAVAAGQAIMSSGYSNYLGLFTKQSRSGGRTVGLAEGRLFYTLDTAHGASGAPVMPTGPDGVPARVVAVHAYGEEARVAGIAEESNSGPWLDATLVALIAEWNASRPAG